MPRVAVKKTFKLAKANELGIIKARVEAEAKEMGFLDPIFSFFNIKNKKEAVVGLKRFLSKHIAEIPELIAIGGLTVVVHHVIVTTDEVIEKMNALITQRPAAAAAILTSPLFGLYGIFLGIIAFQATEVKVPEKPKLAEMFEWVISFAIAYVLVKNGAQILGLLESGSNSIAKLAMLFMS